MSLAIREIHVGDCRELLRRLPDDSVNCVVTSPPYWGLRDYGVAGQLGLEETPEKYIEVMTDVFREVRRVLRPDGTCWVNIGDSYAGAPGGGAGNGWLANRTVNRVRARKIMKKGGTGLKPKDLVGIPWMLAFALRADGWWLRAENIWHKANPIPESVHDRPCRDHEQVFLFTKSAKYSYDAKAVKQPATGTAHSRVSVHEGQRQIGGRRLAAAIGAESVDASSAAKRSTHPKAIPMGAGVRANTDFCSAVTDLVEERNLRTVWRIRSHPYHGAHFATFPPALARVCILAGCPAGGLVLDPFGGSGTVGAVAEEEGRRWILFELSEEYAKLARARTAQRGLLVPEART